VEDWPNLFFLFFAKIRIPYLKFSLGPEFWFGKNNFLTWRASASMVIGNLHALTLLALGCSSDGAGDHCHWAPERVLIRYTRISRVARLKTSAQLLRDGFADSASGVSHMDGAAVFFDALDSGLVQSHTFWMGLSIFRFTSLFQVRICH